MDVRTTDIVVIGAGQAGLAAGHYLAKAGADFVILDAAENVGDQWRTRWDSLRLFTPARHSSLPGAPWPTPGGTLLGKDDVAAYLEDYSRTYNLPIEHATEVSRLAEYDGGFEVTTPRATFRARAVIVATGATQTPRVPAFAARLGPSVVQLHSSTYHRAEEVPSGSVVVIGFGTSGAQIAMELAAAGRTVTLAGKPTPYIPAPFLAVAGRLWWRIMNHVLNRRTPIGRKAAPKATAHGAPLIGISPRSVQRAGVARVGRIEDANEDSLIADGIQIKADAVVWCTGFHGDFEWIDIPTLGRDDHGYPVAPFGESPDVPGLTFLGMPFQTKIASPLIGGVGEDARSVVTGLVAGALSMTKLPSR